MDRLEALGQQLSQVTMYDIKSYYNQAKSIVLNLSEMESKVREATNDDPWGASSTLMNDIAQGTFNFQQFNEIMPAIYSRFMEKEARQWRQIYKALQLLEFLIKNGSERTVDDARSHLSTIKMLRNFHYIDDKGKDQGINVRNRSREISELLSDLDKVRTERRKAKANKAKYIGTGSDGGAAFSSSGTRSGGFGSDSLYGNGGGGSYDRDYEGSSSYASGGNGSGGFRDESRSRYAEYDAGDDEELSVRRSSTSGAGRDLPRSQDSGSTAPAPPPPKQKAPEVDLLGGFDEEPVAAPIITEKALPPTVGAGGAFDATDDFGDFETAPQIAIPSQPTLPVQTQKPNVFGFLSQPQTSTYSAPVQQTQSLGHTRQLSGGLQSNFGSLGGISPALAPVIQPLRQSSFNVSSPSSAGGILSPISATAQGQRPGPKPTSSHVQTKSAGGFDDLWNMSLGSGKVATTPNTSATGGKSILELEREKVQASIWGTSNPSVRKAPNNNGFGAFGGASTANGNEGGEDDLLL